MNQFFSQKIGNILLNYGRGGFKTWVLIFCISGLVLIFPFYYLGGFVGKMYYNQPLKTDYVNPKKNSIKDFKIGKTNIVPLVNGQQEIYTSIDNRQNPEIGYWPWIYRYQILNRDGIVIDENTVESFLLPNELKYLVVRDQTGKGRDIKIFQERSSRVISYNPNNPIFPKKPEIEIINQTGIEENPDKRSLKLTATIKNKDLVEISELSLTYIVRDTRQSIVGINNLKIFNLSPNEERQVDIPSYPKPVDRFPSVLEIRISANFLDEKLVKL